MATQCAIDPEHEFESRSGALQIFRDGSFSSQYACPRCVEAIRDKEITDYRVFVIEGREVVIPLEEISV